MSGKDKKQKVVAVDKANTLIAHDWWATTAPKLSSPQSGNEVDFFICGEDYFKKLVVDLEKAKKYILITDWVMNPDVYLIRDGKLDDKNKLISILVRAAKRGVDIRILIYNSQDWFAFSLDDIATEKKLENAHKNIRVMRTRPEPNFSPHQKTVTIDSEVSYIGGIDLAFGRWDNAEHNLYADPNIYKNDIYNPKLHNKFDVQTQPRMPWQDVHARIEGPSSLDIQKNFIERWAFERRIEPKLEIKTKKIVGKGSSRVQIIRSINSYSVSKFDVVDDSDEDVELEFEESIHEAYLKAIKGSKHFIYIENQFFISNFGTSKIKNNVVNAIAERIFKAIDKSETFRVYVVLPVHPEGVYPERSTNELMHWQFQTILRGKKNILGKIKEKLKKENKKETASDYINFFCLRNYAKLKTYVTEQIYVHTKLMIVDDRVVILGSANINQRSLDGERDSEINGIFLDTSKPKKIKMDKIDTLVRNKAHELRVNLWEQHLGKNYIGKLNDPASEDTLKIFLKVAKNNTDAYEKIFPNIPSSKFHKYKPQLASPDLIKGMSDDAIGKYLKSNIEGHLVFFPLDWLKDESLESFRLPDIITTENKPKKTTVDYV